MTGGQVDSPRRKKRVSSIRKFRRRNQQRGPFIETMVKYSGGKLSFPLVNPHRGRSWPACVLFAFARLRCPHGSRLFASSRGSVLSSGLTRLLWGKDVRRPSYFITGESSARSGRGLPDRVSLSLDANSGTGRQQQRFTGSEYRPGHESSGRARAICAADPFWLNSSDQFLISLAEPAQCFYSAVAGLFPGISL